MIPNAVLSHYQKINGFLFKCLAFIQKFLEPSHLAQLRPKLSFQTGVLAGFALLASLLLGVTHCGSRGAIERRLAEDLKNSLAEVVPNAMHDNDLLTDTITLPSAEFNIGSGQTIVYLARKGEEITAVCFKFTAPDGYSGAINMVMGVDIDGNILGVRVVNHAETPGLGDKIESNKSDWIKKFTGHSLVNTTETQWAVKKDGGVFDQFAGATITPRKTVQAIHRGLQFFQAHKAEWVNR